MYINNYHTALESTVEPYEVAVLGFPKLTHPMINAENADSSLQTSFQHQNNSIRSRELVLDLCWNYRKILNEALLWAFVFLHIPLDGAVDIARLV